MPRPSLPVTLPVRSAPALHHWSCLVDEFRTDCLKPATEAVVGYAIGHSFPPGVGRKVRRTGGNDFQLPMFKSSSRWAVSRCKATSL